MTFTPKPWEDEPNPLAVLEGKAASTSKTPVDAAALIDLEERVTSDAALPSSVVSSSSTPAKGTGVPWVFNVKDGAYGAKGDGATDDATAIQAAITAAKATGGGVVTLPPGTYIVGSALELKSNVTLEGAGPAATIIKLKNTANTDVLKAYKYGENGQDFYGIFNLTIDGNKANNASGGKGIKSDGRRVRIDNVRIKNCKGDGLLHKQSASDLSAAEGGQDTLISNFWIWNCDGNGLVGEAHDAQYTEGFCIGNAKANVLHPSGTGPMICHGIHCWGASEYGWKIEDQTICTDCEAEGASKAMIQVGFATLAWTGGAIFRAGTPENVCGIELTSANSVVWTSPTTYIYETGTAGGVKFAAEGSAACKFLHHFYDAGSARPAFTKSEESISPNKNIRFDVTLGGSTVIGTGFTNGIRPKQLSFNTIRVKDPWRPEGTKAENMPRQNFNNSSALTSGTLYLVGGLILPADEAISTITFRSATTAAETPLNQWACLLDMSRKVLAVSKDKTTTAWGANAKQNFEIETPYTPPLGEDKPVYVGLLVKATVVPTLQAIESTNTFPHNEAPILAGNSNAGLTNPASGPAVGATATAITASSKRAYCTVN